MAHLHRQQNREEHKRYKKLNLALIMKNDIALRMLQKEPQTLVCTVEFQESIKKIVRKFKQKGGFGQETEADVIQEITTQMLEEKIARIQKNYNPKYGNLKQYFERSVYNIAVELVQASNKRKSSSYDLDQVNPQSLSSASHLRQDLILDELKKVHIFFKKYNRQGAKLLLLLKLYSRSTVTAQDILDYSPNATKEEITEVLNVFGHNYAIHDDNFLYAQINGLINETEGKKNSSDALRKWLSNRLTDLNTWMNRQSTLTYDNEALRNLMQLFFMNQNKVC